MYMDRCAAKILLEIKCAALLKRLKTTDLYSYYYNIVSVAWCVCVYKYIQMPETENRQKWTAIECMVFISFADITTLINSPRTRYKHRIHCRAWVLMGPPRSDCTHGRIRITRPVGTYCDPRTRMICVIINITIIIIIIIIFIIIV
jgi:hypothetical protein